MKKLKFAIAGLGNRGIISFGGMLAARPDCEITALIDTNRTRLHKAAEFLNITPHLYATASEMLAEESPDGVIIATPDYTHEAIALELLKNNVNVLIDKPLATTMRACANIIRAADEAGGILMMGFNLRHHPVMARLKKIVDDGILGKIHLIENREFYDGGRTYMSRWNRHYHQSGGLWIHKGSHDFDVFQWLLGFPKPVRVSAVAGMNVLTPNHLPFPLKDGIEPGPCCQMCAYYRDCPDHYELPEHEKLAFSPETAQEDNYYRDLCMYLSDKDVHDNGIAIVEYDNGARASHLESFIGSLNDRKYTLVGDKGIAEASLTNLEIIVYPRWSQEKIIHKISPVDGCHGGADPALLEAFIATVKGEQSNTSTALHGLWATATGQAAELAWREKRTVNVSELL